MFAGHIHRYTEYTRRGRQYIVLGTTGGVGGDGGIGVGEFDHVTQVTMTPEGPRVANLLLEGIQPVDVYTEQDALLTRSLSGGEELAVDSIPFSGQVVLSPENPMEEALKLTLAAHPGTARTSTARTSTARTSTAWNVTPKTQTVALSPGQRAELALTVAFDGAASDLLPTPTLIATAIDASGRERTWTVDVPLDLQPFLAQAPRSAESYRVAVPPTIDGRLDEAIWDRPADVDGLFHRNVRRWPALSTEAWLAHTQEALHVAVRAEEPRPDLVVTRQTVRDSRVWTDDAIKIHLSRGHLTGGHLSPDDDATFYVAVNAAGVIADSKNGRMRWDGEVSAATATGPDAWTVEIAIPWRSLGLDAPVDGATLGLDLSRFHPGAEREHSVWSPLDEVPGAVTFRDALRDGGSPP